MDSHVEVCFLDGVCVRFFASRDTFFFFSGRTSGFFSVTPDPAETLGLKVPKRIDVRTIIIFSFKEPYLSFLLQCDRALPKENTLFSLFRQTFLFFCALIFLRNSSKRKTESVVNPTTNQSYPSTGLIPSVF